MQQRKAGNDGARYEDDGAAWDVEDATLKGWATFEAESGLSPT